jgi:hypothetical protein
MLPVPDQVSTELDKRIDRQQFEEAIGTLNNLYEEAEKLGCQ